MLSDLSNIDGLVNSVDIYIFYKLLLEQQRKNISFTSAIIIHN